MSSTCSSSSTPGTSPCSTPAFRPTHVVEPLLDVSTSFIPTTLARGSSTITYQIPARDHARATTLIQNFLASLNGGSKLSDLEFELSFLAHLSHPQQKEDFHIFEACFSDFEGRYLQDDDIHSAAADLEGDSTSRQTLLHDFYQARQAASIFTHKASPPSALLSAAARGSASVYAIFGGQGNTETLFADLQRVCTTYEPLIGSFVARSCQLLLSLSRNPSASYFFGETPLDLAAWMAGPSSAPDSAFFIAAPVSFPLIGFLQLLHYIVACKVLGLGPEEFGAHLNGLTGHSQGIVVAAVVSAANSEESFAGLAELALTVLFWTGVRAQQAFPTTWLAPAMVDESVASGEGVPTPMLSVRDLPLERLEREVAALNKHLSAVEQVSVALINDPRNNIVVAGSPASLCALNQRLRRIKAPADLDQSRIPFSQRKSKFSSSFLPITAPFHTKALASATEIVLEDVAGFELNACDLRLPVYHTDTGEDIRSLDGNIIPALVSMITEQPVHWSEASIFPSATHILDFGPGGTSGIGALTARSKTGTGVSVILADTMTGASNPELSYKPSLFSPQPSRIPRAPHWAATCSPRLVRAAGRTIIDTPLSRLLGTPPLIVAGMTPTTAHASFAAAVMQAGYHVELAAGGFPTASALESALRTLAASAPPGRGITVNLIYAAPRALAWQVPLLARLRQSGLPIDGVTLGAGVPSPEAAAPFFTMGLRHVGFKPGSVAAIDAVLDLADRHPRTAVVLQWTGGRGGGHHSCEDFHSPLLRRYAAIRRRRNVVLVAGSGFGGAADTWPYLTGTWAERFGYPRMPLDGVLFGSRMMVAAEARTSADVKKAIIAAKGLPDGQWEATYRGSAAKSDIITIVSEMGEPMHVLATRGARLWAELDEKVFSKPAEEQAKFLAERREHVMERLDRDFQKVWFAHDSSGKALELHQMTYAEVTARLHQLLVVDRDGEARWIDPSYRVIVVDWLRRVEQRFATAETPSRVPGDAPTPTGMHAATRSILDQYPASHHQLLCPEDTAFFLQLCRRRGGKPVPFVPSLDENFQTYFKKDSLWQSENLDAVAGRDPGRVLILHGPVAAQYSTQEETVKDILDRIHEGHVCDLLQERYGDELDAVPEVEYLDQSDVSVNGMLQHSVIIQTAERVVIQLPTSADLLPSADALHRFLAGKTPSWRRAIFVSEVFMSGQLYQDNPIRRIFTPSTSQNIEIENPHNANQIRISLGEPSPSTGEQVTVATISFDSDAREVILRLKHHQTVLSGQPADLVLRFGYHPECSVTPMREILEGRVERVKDFYWRLWYGDSPREASTLHGPFRGDEVKMTGEIIRDFTAAVGNHSSAYLPRAGSIPAAPLDLAFIVAWKAVMKPLFAIDADLLRLVHLSNGFRVLPGQSPLQDGDVVTSSAVVTAVANEEAGAMVEVRATVSRDAAVVVKITSRFLYRGVHLDASETFSNVVEKRMEVKLDRPSQVAVLRSRSWFKELDPEADLVGKTLVFQLRTTTRFSEDRSTCGVNTTGEVTIDGQSVGSVAHSSVAPSAQNNIVMQYLQRHGQPVHKAIPLKCPISVNGPQGQQHRVRVPLSNARYAAQSGDFNPIHTSRAFASLTSLPGTITHGMYTSAAVRGVLDQAVADGHPGRVRSYHAAFRGMVLPGDELAVSLRHTAMVDGHKVVEVEARRGETDELVLSATAEVEQPPTAYIFTGQGAQRKGMGMELRDSSEAAAEVWRRADEYFLRNYGFAISSIVRDDPKELTIHFGGTSGRCIRANYLAILRDAASSDRGAAVRASALFRALTAPRCAAYTFQHHLGLLSATQFTQPALTIMEVARFADLKARGLLPDSIGSSNAYAGHSLGEYGALAALGGFMPVEKLAAITFVRGLTMSMAVERDDASGRSVYSMCAVNPSKVHQRGAFDEAALQALVAAIVDRSGWLLEVVNYNIAGMQYICAGHVRALACLTGVLNDFVARPVESRWLDPQELAEAVRPHVEAAAALPEPVDYERGPATVPLKQIDVPFHSRHLAGGVDTYRRFLRSQIRQEDMVPQALVGRWIPNITGRSFGISKEHFEEMQAVTGSERLRGILGEWEKFDSERRQEEIAAGA